jgi:hypothetical protein
LKEEIISLNIEIGSNDILLEQLATKMERIERVFINPILKFL